MKKESILDLRGEGNLMPLRKLSSLVPVTFWSYRPANKQQLAVFELKIGWALLSYPLFLGEADPQGSDLTSEELRKLANITQRELRSLAALAERPPDCPPKAIVEALKNRTVVVGFGHANDGGMAILGFAENFSAIAMGTGNSEERVRHE